MTIDLEKLEQLPLRTKVSVTFAMIGEKTRNIYFTDVECSRHWHKIWSKAKAKNAKAKHRKKFRR